MEHGLPEVSNQETTSSEPNRIYMVGQAYPLSPAKQYTPNDETITESYSETYDENCNVHDGTPTCSLYSDDSLDGLLPCDLFSEEDEYENEDKYNLLHDTSDQDSLMSDKDVDNEPEIFDGFVDSPIYCISKGESMHLVGLGNFDMEKEHAVYPYDQSEAYIRISNEDKENLILDLISGMGNPSHLT